MCGLADPVVSCPLTADSSGRHTLQALCYDDADSTEKKNWCFRDDIAVRYSKDYVSIAAGGCPSHAFFLPANLSPAGECSGGCGSSCGGGGCGSSCDGGCRRLAGCGDCGACCGCSGGCSSGCDNCTTSPNDGSCDAAAEAASLDAVGKFTPLFHDVSVLPSAAPLLTLVPSFDSNLYSPHCCYESIHRSIHL